MKTLSWLACSLTLASALACCGYDNGPYGYAPAGYYSTPGYVTTYPAVAGPTYYGRGYSGYGTPNGYGSSYPRTYTSNRYLQPLNTQAYVYGDPLSRHMSVGGYGYVPPAPRPAPWPLR